MPFALFEQKKPPARARGVFLEHRPFCEKAYSANRAVER